MRQCTAYDRMADGSMSPSEVVEQLLEGWRAGSCWGLDCKCATFTPPQSTAAAGAGGGKGCGGGMTCSCGHSYMAHELIDSNAEELRGGRRESLSQQYRFYRGAGDAEAGATSAELGVSLRRLFTAIRNARAVGDCGLFEDSKGVGGWGAGWFLSR